MPIIAPFTAPQGLTSEQVAALQEVRARAVKAQSVGATILSNMTQAIRSLDAILDTKASA